MLCDRTLTKLFPPLSPLPVVHTRPSHFGLLCFAFVLGAGVARAADVEPKVVEDDLHEPQGRPLSHREGQGMIQDIS